MFFMFFSTLLLFHVTICPILNFVSDNTSAFEDIIEGVTANDLNRELRYARAADKTDKSLEAYKFYTNALYVALTRAVRNVYIIESFVNRINYISNIFSQ